MRKVTLTNKKPLTGTGYVWESILAQAGWNNLPEKKKYGLADKDLIVKFPHCGNIELVLFPDEVIYV